MDWSGGGLSSSTSVDWSGGSKVSGSGAGSGVGADSGFEWGGQAPNKPVNSVASGGGSSTMFGSTSMPNMAGVSSAPGMMGGGMMGGAGVITTQAAMPGFGAMTTPGFGAGTTPFSATGE